MSAKAPGAPAPPSLRALAIVLVLFAGWLSLPVRLDRSPTGPSSEACLTIADVPAGGGPDALASLERCAVLVPDDVEILADLGAAYEASGRAPEAEAAYRRALERDPDYADVHGRLARLLLARGETGGARRHVEAALTLQPNRRVLTDLLAAVAEAEASEAAP